MNPLRPTDFFTEATQDPEVRRHFERERAADEFLMQVEDLMEAEGVSRTTLAERLRCSPANITRLLRRGTNITIGKMVDICLALNHRVRPVVESADEVRPDWGWIQCKVESASVLSVSIPARAEPCSAFAATIRLPRMLAPDAEQAFA